jgi:hypothetical protein
MSDIVQKLNAVFPLSDHNIRKGGGYGDNTQWFVYIKKDAIVRRLDSLFPMEWETKLSDIRRTIHNDGEFDYGTSTVSCAIIIKDKTRESNGSSVDKPINKYVNKKKTVIGYTSENTEKSAATDAFKRAARMWGIGLYLEQSPSIECKNKSDAEMVFASWYNDVISVDNDVIISPEDGDDEAQSELDEYLPTEGFSESSIEITLQRYFPLFVMADFLHEVQCNNLTDRYGDEVAAKKGLLNYCHHMQYQFRATHYRYMFYGNKTCLEFSSPKISGGYMKSICTYDRSKGLRGMVGDEYYQLYNFGRFDNATQSTDWIEMPFAALLGYENGEHLKLTDFIAQEN